MTWLLLIFLLEITGTLRDDQQRPLPNVQVSLLTEGSATVISTTKADQHGVYHFSDLPAGAYRVRAELAGYTSATSDVLKQTTNLDLVLKPAFFDEPQYTVAGVTDNTYRGGHGADTVLRSSEALTKAAAALGNKPDAEEEANYKQAAHLIEEGKFQAALPYLEQAARIQPKNAAVFHLSGIANEGLGNALPALHAYQRAAELDPSEPNIFDLGTELLTHLAYDAAIQTFTRGNNLFPKSARMQLGLAVALYAQGQYEKAAEQFFGACDLDPANPKPYLFLGKVQRAEITGSNEFASRMRRFAELQPQDPQANYLYAVVLARQGQQVDAKLLFNKAIRLDPKFAAAYLQLGILNYNVKDLPAAIAAFRHASEADPALEEPHYRLAQIYKLAGDQKLASSELEAYNRISKQNATDLEKQRSEVQRFVITLQNQPQ
jgi:Flp pilus assembly protein TadD